MPRMRAAAVLLPFLIAAPATAQRNAWVHLAIRDADRARAEVRINLPAPVVMRAAPLVPESEGRGYRLVVGEDSITARDLAAILAALREIKDGETVRRDTGDAIVEATRTGDRVQLIVDDETGGESLVATLPLGVANVLAAGGRRLDLAGAVRHLAAGGGGELALIAADHARIRIWVDGIPEQQGE